MKKIITISRQFGSGGREIGEAVAKKLGIEVYDKYIIEHVAEQSGFEKNLVQNALTGNTPGRYASRKFKINGMNIDELLYIEEKRIINDLASKGACVFIGRCTDYILKDNKEAMHVFIYGDPKVRADRISKGDYEGKESPEKILKEKDNKRATNYAHFTGRQWGEPTNYDLMINSSKLSFDECVDLIVEAYNK